VQRVRGSGGGCYRSSLFLCTGYKSRSIKQDLEDKMKKLAKSQALQLIVLYLVAFGGIALLSINIQARLGLFSSFVLSEFIPTIVAALVIILFGVAMLRGKAYLGLLQGLRQQHSELRLLPDSLPLLYTCHHRSPIVYLRCCQLCLC
jgi:hypothetical protein